MPENYAQYNALSPRERKALPATNFWLIAAGREPIAVPAKDKDYHRYFTDVQRKNALSIWADRQSGFLKMVTISLDQPKGSHSHEEIEEVVVAPRERIQPPPRQKQQATKIQNSLF